jgi:hypothetical protein
MKTWMLPLLVPAGLIGSVVFVVVFDPYQALAAGVAGALLIPVLWRRNSPGRGGDEDTNYWRLPRL